MPFEISWGAPGMLHFTFSGDVTGKELMDCIIKGDQFLAEKPNYPFYVWVEVRKVRKYPPNIFRALLRAGHLKYMPNALIVIGATAYQTMIIRLAAITFWGVDFKPMFVSSAEDGQEALKKMQGAATQQSVS